MKVTKSNLENRNEKKMKKKYKLTSVHHFSIFSDHCRHHALWNHSERLQRCVIGRSSEAVYWFHDSVPSPRMHSDVFHQSVCSSKPVWICVVRWPGGLMWHWNVVLWRKPESSQFSQSAMLSWVHCLQKYRQQEILGKWYHILWKGRNMLKKPLLIAHYTRSLPFLLSFTPEAYHSTHTSSVSIVLLDLERVGIW